jgi:hypothetical protein
MTGISRTRFRDESANVRNDRDRPHVERTDIVVPEAMFSLPDAGRTRLVRGDRPVALKHHS